MSLWTLLLVLLVASRSALTARILAALPITGRSHQIVLQPYVEGLAGRGHNVTSITFFPRQTPLPNLTEIDLSASINITALLESFTIEDVQSENRLLFFFVFIYFGLSQCEHVFQQPEIQKLIQSDEHFDLVITESFNTDCFDAFAYKFNAPSIKFGTAMPIIWANTGPANPDNPSYIPHLFSGFVAPMTFFERLSNTVGLLLYKLGYTIFVDWPTTLSTRRHFGWDLPLLSRIAANASVLFTNVHHTLHGARPSVPGVIEVGGIHVRPPRKLPEDIQKFLDESKDGVIYFSMGSGLRSSTFPEEKRKAFLDAFAEIPQRVLWKFEQESLPGQPKNVKIGKWLPQNEILGHPNVRAFISHGGLGGTIEAVHHGVPIIGIPIFGDQPVNVRRMEALGVAVRLEYQDISKDTVLAVLTDVLEKPSYRKNAKRLSQTFKDRPLPPLDTALYWTEYVLRHNGAPHLRSAGADLTWYQYHLLDIAAVLLVSVVAVVFIARRACSTCSKKTLPVVHNKNKRQ